MAPPEGVGPAPAKSTCRLLAVAGNSLNWIGEHERAENMLAFPIIKRTVQEVCECGEPSVTIIEPVDWSARDAVAFARAASELARLAADMEKATESKHVIKVIGNVDLNEL